MTKTYAKVWAECPTLRPAERWLYGGAAEALADCPFSTAFRLYVADLLRFDGHDSAVVAAAMKHVSVDLDRMTADLGPRLAKREAQMPVYRLAVYDGRFFGGIDGPLLDVVEGQVLAAAPADFKLVAYNLTSLALARWAGLSPRPESPGVPHDPKPPEPGPPA